MKWTKINESKPPVGVPLIVTIHDTFRNRNELRYPVYYQKSLFDGKYGFFQYGAEENRLTKEYSPVLSYTEFPDIYDESAEGVDEPVIVTKENLLSYLQSMLDKFKAEEEKLGREETGVDSLFHSMIACKEMVEALIGEPVNLQKDGKVTVGF